MTVKETIKALEQVLHVHGDVDVYVNGEYGISDVRGADGMYVSSGSAGKLFDCDGWMDENEVVCHIGGA